jgi:hypothetical protein
LHVVVGFDGVIKSAFHFNYMSEINLTYITDMNWERHLRLESLDKVDDMTLRYDVLPGDVIFIVGGVDFSARWGWVPVLDFVACLNIVIKRLSEGEPNLALDFTESGADIMFKRTHDSILISSNYTPGQAIVQFEDLARAAAELSRKVSEDIRSNYPELSKNPHLRKFGIPPPLNQSE